MPQLALGLPATAARLPAGLRPMLARAGAAPDVPGYLCDAGWAGLRVLAFLETDGEVRLVAPSGREVGPRLPEVVAALQATGLRGAILDGEIVVPGPDGRHDPAGLRARLHRRADVSSAPAALLASDLPWADGRSRLVEPLGRRRARLAQLLDPAPHLVPLAPLEGEPAALAAALRGLGLPALFVKRLDGPYLPGIRSRLWRRVALTGEPGEAAAGGSATAVGATAAAEATRRPVLVGLLRLPLG